MIFVAMRSLGIVLLLAIAGCHGDDCCSRLAEIKKILEMEGGCDDTRGDPGSTTIGPLGPIIGSTPKDPMKPRPIGPIIGSTPIGPMKPRPIGPIIPCPDNWVGFNGSCYIFSNYKANFHDAENFCSDHRAHVIHVENEEKIKFVKKHLRMMYKRSSSRIGKFWIGSNADYITASYAYYYYDYDPKASDCVQMVGKGKFKKTVVSCADLATVICELETVDGDYENYNW